MFGGTTTVSRSPRALYPQLKQITANNNRMKPMTAHSEIGEMLIEVLIYCPLQNMYRHPGPTEPKEIFVFGDFFPWIRKTCGRLEVTEGSLEQSDET
jgi:hypothetical protein